MRADLHARGAAASERGRRRANQDAVLLVRLADGAELAAVADGMGGSAGGEVASECALSTLRAELEAGAELHAAVRAANHAVIATAAARPELSGMGTTVVALLRRGEFYTVVNVGDSRAYRVDSERITQLTLDHSFVAEAVRSGRLSAQQAGRSQWRNAVTRAVGTDPDVEVDAFGPFAVGTAHTVLLCSDGLYRVLGDDELRRIVLAAPDPRSAARQLTDAALAAGSDDNISVVLLTLSAPVMSAASPEPALRAAPVPPRSLPARQPWPVELGAGIEPQRGVRWTSTRIAIILVVAVLAILYVVLPG